MSAMPFQAIVRGIRENPAITEVNVRLAPTATQQFPPPRRWRGATSQSPSASRTWRSLSSSARNASTTSGSKCLPRSAPIIRHASPWGNAAR